MEGDQTVSLDVDASACRELCVSGGMNVSDYPFSPYTFPAGCKELLVEDNTTIRRATAIELDGRLVRRSLSAEDNVDIRLPCPGTRQSLSRLHDLRLDTLPPRIDFVVSLRSPGVYVSGEKIDLQV